MHSSRKFECTLFTSTIQQLGEQIACTVGHAKGLNSCNANLYVNGNHALGMHADDEYLFGAINEPKLIVSLSLEAARDSKIFVNKEDLTFTVKLLNGEIATMEDLFQQECNHGVPAVDGPRINLT